MKVIVAPEHFDRLPEITEDTEDEEDMLDLAVDLDWEWRRPQRPCASS